MMAGAPAAGANTAGLGGAVAGQAGVAGTSGLGGAGGATTGGVGGTAAATCAAQGLICEGFETYAPSRPPNGIWTSSVRGNGAIVVDTTHFFSGKQSLHVTGRLNQDRANIATPVATESAVIYVRFMYYGVSYPASSGVHTRLARIGTQQAASGTADTSYSIATYNGTAIEKANAILLRDTSTHLNAPEFKNRWTCFEYAVDKSGGVGKVAVKLWLNGRQLQLSPAGSSGHGMTSTSWDPIAFELFMLGLDGFQNDEQRADFWIDDLLVGPERVGCPPADEAQ